MNKIKDVRMRKKMTQQQLSEKSGLSQAYINELENGRKVNPSIIVLDRIAAVLQVSIAELLEAEAISIAEIARNIDQW
jgi:Predicted transcriptional regulators